MRKDSKLIIKNQEFAVEKKEIVSTSVENKTYNLSIKTDSDKKELNLKIKPLKINISKYNFDFPADGMF